MTTSARAFLTFLLVASAGACASAASEGPSTSNSEPFMLITRLGDDTVAVERVTRTRERIDATVLLRSPQTTLRTFHVLLDPAGQPTSMGVERHDPATGAVLEASDVDLTLGSGIPFIEMVHFPFELMLERMIAAPTDTLTLPLIAGDRTVAFRMARNADGTFSATHPTRGTMTIESDVNGRMRSLDASRTTRALRVLRTPVEADIMALAASFANRPMGELSGRGEVAVNVAGSDIAVDYGVPLKRGRDIFGALVPWNAVWRTGANRATHFSTSRALRVGDDVIPAGTYTLFTIPRPDRWTLIVNRNVDINGQAYDAAADLVHLDLAVRALDQVVEPFTIVVEPDGPSGGLLRLRWDRTEAWVPFVVQ